MRSTSYNEKIHIKKEVADLPNSTADVLVIERTQVISGVTYGPTKFKEMVKYSYYGTPAAAFNDAADAYAERCGNRRAPHSASSFYEDESDLSVLRHIFGI